MRSGRGNAEFTVSEGVTGQRHIFVNLYFIEDIEAADGSWVLVDAGLAGHKSHIKKFAAKHFGPNSKPKAILLTHGHFDHIGALQDLAREWNVPVFAHPLELPYLTGKSHYPPADPTVGGGGMARMSFLYPTNPINISGHLKILPQDGSVPGLTGWRWFHTPGHSPGHVSFFRESDRTLISGDAFVSTNQASVISVATQREEITGPPPYLTTDWEAARESVVVLAALEPEHAGTGHGKPLHGNYLKKGLRLVADNFNTISKPTDGRYVRQPALTNEEGIVKLPPSVPDMFMRAVATVGLTLVVGTALGVSYFKKYKKQKTKARTEGGHGPRYDLP